MWDDPQQSTPPPQQTITSRSRKEEILAAYEELRMKTEGKNQPAIQTKKEAATKPPSSQLQLPIEALIQDLTELRSRFNSVITELTERLVAEIEKFNRFQKNLEAEKQALESEIAKQRQIWEEDRRQKEKERIREEEDYRYQLEKGRKREADVYQETKVKREKEFLERESKLAAAEEELNRLRSETQELPEKLEKAVEAAKKEARQLAEAEAKIKQELLAKGVDGEQRLKDQQISILQKTVQEQTAEISALRKELERTTDRFKELASKIIEGKCPRETPESPKSN